MTAILIGPGASGPIQVPESEPWLALSVLALIVVVLWLLWRWK